MLTNVGKTSELWGAGDNRIISRNICFALEQPRLINISALQWNRIWIVQLYCSSGRNSYNNQKTKTVLLYGFSRASSGKSSKCKRNVILCKPRIKRNIYFMPALYQTSFVLQKRMKILGRARASLVFVKYF